MKLLEGKTRILIAGPPGSGKSTLVRKLKEPGDILIEFDALHEALGQEPHVYSKHGMRIALSLFREAKKVLWSSNAERIWVTETAARPSVREPFFHGRGLSVVLPVSPEVCLERCLNDPKRSHIEKEQWQAWIDNWWNLYKPHPKDVDGLLL